MDSRTVIEDLQRRLDAVADPGTREWFENYLKGAIAYRGVKTPAVAKIVAEWRRSHRLGELSLDGQLDLARTLIRGTFAEDKFAGTLYMQRHLVKQIDADRLLGAAEELFAAGAFHDWSTTDWFSVRVLGPLIALRGDPVATRVAEWRTAEDLWQRRSAIVPFRAVIRRAEYHPLIEATVAALVTEPERFIQTGIGWVISDLSKAHPRVAAALVERHLDNLSPEVIRRHTRHLPGHAVYKKRKRQPSPAAGGPKDKCRDPRPRHHNKGSSDA